MITYGEDVQFKGNVYFNGTIFLPAGCVADTQVAALADIAASKLEHDHRQVYAQESATTAAAHTRVVHVVKGATGTLQGFSAGCVVANVGDSVVTVDLLKNGASVLSAVITIDSADAARAVVDGVITSDAVVADDVLEVVVTATVGTGTLGKGVFASMDLYEKAN